MCHNKVFFKVHAIKFTMNVMYVRMRNYKMMAITCITKLKHPFTSTCIRLEKFQDYILEDTKLLLYISVVFF